MSGHRIVADRNQGETYRKVNGVEKGTGMKNRMKEKQTGRKERSQAGMGM